MNENAMERNLKYRIPYNNVIDADGHILEPPDIWEKYIDPQYRDKRDSRSSEQRRERISRNRRPSVEVFQPKNVYAAGQYGRKR